MAAEYAALKRALAAAHPADRAAYTAGKDAFVARVLAAGGAAG
ncbi:GrpB family protein [Roseisolibacter sp. H3M3-2]